MSISPESFTREDVKLLCERMDQLFDEGFILISKYTENTPSITQGYVEKWHTQKYLDGT